MKIKPKTILGIEPLGFESKDHGGSGINEPPAEAEKKQLETKREVSIAKAQVELKNGLPELLKTPLTKMFKKDYTGMKAPTKLVVKIKQNEEIGYMLEVVWRCGFLVEKQGRKTSRISKLAELLTKLESGSQKTDYSHSFIRELREFINSETLHNN
jgi:hypothetical protein